MVYLLESLVLGANQTAVSGRSIFYRDRDLLAKSQIPILDLDFV